jgi:hypothetical protein
LSENDALRLRIAFGKIARARLLQEYGVLVVRSLEREVFEALPDVSRSAGPRWIEARGQA